jgi:hypothetical protein
MAMAKGLSGILESPRRRRRLIVLVVLAAIGATIGSLIVFDRNSAKTTETPLTKGAPAVAPANPTSVPLTPRKRAMMLNIARRFLESGVAGHHFERSWNLTGPEIHQGFTKKTWGPNNSTLVPFRYDYVRWRLDHSFQNEVGLQVALYPKPHDKDYPSPMVFDIVISHYAHAKVQPWKVSYWEPAPGQAQVVHEQKPGTKLALSKTGGGSNQLSSVWLIAPGIVFLLILLIPIVIGVREWRRSRRARRDYEATLPSLSRYTTSSSKPS